MTRNSKVHHYNNAFPLRALQLAATRTILWSSASRSNLQRGRGLCDVAFSHGRQC